VNDVTRKLEEAKVVYDWCNRSNRSNRSNMCIYFGLAWDEPWSAFQYLIMWRADDNGNLEEFVDHLECEGLICPICYQEASHWCHEFSSEQLNLIKEKLIKSNLKLMFVLE
jgi:hypothetical protein